MLPITVVALVAVVYAIVVALYASSGDVAVRQDAADGDVVLQLTPERVDTGTNRIVGSLLPVKTAADETVGENVVAASDFSVLVSGGDGTRTIDYSESQVLSPAQVEFLAEGAIERWPFDTYTVTTVVVAVADLDGDGDLDPLPTAITGAGRVPGWDIEAETVDIGATYDTGDEVIEVPGMRLEATRSGSTVAFGIVLLSLMVVMPVLVLTVALTVFRGRRKVEATMMSWIGAMLFATIPLRNFLPGNPPIGSWVDYLIVLWVIAGLVVGLVVFVAAWLRLGPDGPASAPSAAGEGARQVHVSGRRRS